jgi:hypothetical protein
VGFSTLVPRTEDQTYLVHSGSVAGTSCTFELLSPPRSKTIPYAYLQMIDTREDRLIILRYSFADVELTLSRNFCGKRQFLDDLANFRVSIVRETALMKIRILLEPPTDKTEGF